MQARCCAGTDDLLEDGAPCLVLEQVQPGLGWEGFAGMSWKAFWMSDGSVDFGGLRLISR